MFRPGFPQATIDTAANLKSGSKLKPGDSPGFLLLISLASNLRKVVQT
jgi:hypothetical protein